MSNLNIFEILYKNFKIEKPIRLIEFFAGYGSQALALKYLGANFEHYKICEWAINSIIAYASLHRSELSEYGENYCGDLTKEQIASELYSMGVSKDYNKPATLDQLNRMNEEKLRLCFNSIMWSNNLVDISRVKGNDLHIDNVDDYTYLLTYSFPCQDLSLAGKGAGMEKGTGTRSGLLWEVERILSECKNKPQVLLMENVPQVHGQGNLEHFKQWMLRLEEFGYQNYWEDLSATEFGIPQTRNRTFMVSILGNYNYNFPKKTRLKLRLKNLLQPEEEVDEKYYLSEKQIEDVKSWKAYEKPLEQMEKIDKSNISPTLTTRTGAYAAGMILIKNATKKGYLEAQEGDGIDISSRMATHRGTVQKGKAQTITCKGGENGGVVVKEKKCENCKYYQYTNSSYFGGVPYCIKRFNDLIHELENDKIYFCEDYEQKKDFNSNLRIRKLTPKECFRLMGLKDEDIDYVMKKQSDDSGYHLAGDSIVTTCLMAILGQMLDINWKDKFENEEWWKNDNI